MQMIHLILFERNVSDILLVRLEEKGEEKMESKTKEAPVRRSAGTAFLKECIADALLKLMETKEFDKITVVEITNLANVGRATYFRHFNSKEEVLVYKIHLLWEAWTESCCLEEQLHFTKEDLTACFEFIYSIRDMSRLLMRADKLNVLLIALGAELDFSVAKDQYELYAYHFIVIGLSAVLTEWIKRGYCEPPKNLIDYLMEHVLPGSIS